MSENDMKDDSQKYIDEMMRFYSMNKDASVSTDTAANTAQSAEAYPETPLDEPPENDGVTETAAITQPEDISAEEANETAPPSDGGDDSEMSFESRFPIPVIPDFIREQSPVPEEPEPPAPKTDYGFLKVEVRTGENGLPVPDASVTVYEKGDNGENILFSGVTDRSGSLPKIKLPAPVNQKGSTPESFEEYSVYTVSVFAKDFFREVSADVPVFYGITSIQRFNLIPMPFNYDDRGQSIVSENTEPDI